MACFFYYHSKFQSYKAIFGIHQSIIIIQSNYNFQLNRYNSLGYRLSSFELLRLFWVIFGYFLLFFDQYWHLIISHNTNIETMWSIIIYTLLNSSILIGNKQFELLNIFNWSFGSWHNRIVAILHSKLIIICKIYLFLFAAIIGCLSTSSNYNKFRVQYSNYTVMSWTKWSIKYV